MDKRIPVCGLCSKRKSHRVTLEVLRLRGEEVGLMRSRFLTDPGDTGVRSGLQRLIRHKTSQAQLLPGPFGHFTLIIGEWANIGGKRARRGFWDFVVASWHP